MTSVFQKARKGVKAQDENAEFDIREDEEQAVKQDETIQLLLAAGYFRARIKGLSVFDKVVGGMVWCVTASNVDVDVDLLFQENSTIGQKITLTEKIVSALNRMNPNLRLEPHQIQGMDFRSIFPVVQWLVKRTFEARREKEMMIRRRALGQFNKTNKTPQQIAFDARKDTCVQALSIAKESYKPRRMYRPKSLRSAVDENRVQATLLEYGRRYGISRQPKKKDESAEKSKIAQSLGETDEEDDLARQKEENIQKLMTGMANASEGDVSTSAIGDIFSTQSAAIAELSSEYAKHAANLEQSESERGSGLAAHTRAVASLQKRIEQISAKIERANAEKESAESKANAAKERLAQIRSERAELDEETARLDALEGDEANQPIIAQLRRLVNLHDSVKGNEKKFKATCHSEREGWEAKINDLKASGAMHIDAARAAEIQEKYTAEKAKLDKLRIRASKKTRQIALVNRKIDEIPSRAELAQYQRRFDDLSKQMAATFREQKQFITMYNSLSDMQSYYMKEEKLLTSINDNLQTAMSSSSQGAAFLKQLESIVGGVEKNKEMLNARSEEEKTARDKLRDNHLALLDVERLYNKTIREYKKEMSKNEKIYNRLLELGINPDE